MGFTFSPQCFLPSILINIAKLLPDRLICCFRTRPAAVRGMHANPPEGFSGHSGSRNPGKSHLPARVQPRAFAHHRAGAADSSRNPCTWCQWMHRSTLVCISLRFRVFKILFFWGDAANLAVSCQKFPLEWVRLFW